MTWPTLRYPRYTLPQDHWDPTPAGVADGLVRAHPADRPGAAVAVQHVLPRAVQLRVLRHPARLRPGRHARQRPRGRGAALQHHVRAGARARLARGVRAGPAARRGPDRRGGGRGGVRVRAVAAGSGRPPARALQSAASRWRWPCWPAGTAGRCATATGPSAGTTAGLRRLARWRPGSSASASASACRSRTCWPASGLVAALTWCVRRTRTGRGSPVRPAAARGRPGRRAALRRGRRADGDPLLQGHRAAPVRRAHDRRHRHLLAAGVRLLDRAGGVADLGRAARGGPGGAAAGIRR